MNIYVIINFIKHNRIIKYLQNCLIHLNRIHNIVHEILEREWIVSIMPIFYTL